MHDSDCATHNAPAVAPGACDCGLEAPKPCPFCGSQPLVEPANPDNDYDVWGVVRCVSDDCPAQPAVHNDGSGVVIVDGRNSRQYVEAVIRRWNTRASATGAPGGTQNASGNLGRG
jgi:hypothetical protein